MKTPVIARKRTASFRKKVDTETDSYLAKGAPGNSASLAFLTKGLIGIIFPPAIVGIWLVIQKRWRDVFKLVHLQGILLFLAIASPWVILVQRANNDFLWTFFIKEHFLRYATSTHGRFSVFYYLLSLVLGTIPWLAFFIQIFWESGKKRAFILNVVSHRFLLIWAAFILLFFLISSGKLITYFAPLFLPVAVIFGHAFRNHEEEKVDSKGEGTRVFSRRFPVVAQAFIFFVSLCAPPFLKRHAVPGGEWWLLVLVPILVLPVTVFLPDILYMKRRKGWFLTVYLLSAILLGSIVFPLSRYLTPFRSSFPVAKALKEFLPPSQELYQYRIYLRGINFYSKIRTPIVGRADELQSKKQTLPPDERAHYFLTKETFYEICKQKGGLYCITQGADKYEELKENISHVRVIWKNDTFYLLYLEP